MNLHELIQHSAIKAGQVRLEYETDTEPENRGFVVDKITAFLGDRPVGYLKMSYVPKEKFHEFYPSVLHFESGMNGKNYIPYSILRNPKIGRKHWMEYDEDTKRQILTNLLAYHQRDKQNKAKTIPLDHVEAWIRRFEKDMTNNRNGYREFYGRVVNKPIVDYIRVDSGNVIDSKPFGREEGEYESLHRKGIGGLLYKAGSEWMKSRGMRLHASGIQSNAAQAAWRKMTSRGMVKKGKHGRRFLENEREEYHEKVRESRCGQPILVLGESFNRTDLSS